MTREEVWEKVAKMLREETGRLLDVRDVRRVRRVVGDAWTVTVVLVTSKGDVLVTEIVVDEAGHMTPPHVTAEQIIEAIKRAEEPAKVAKIPDELGDFGAGFDEEPEAEPGLEMLSDIGESVGHRVTAALRRGDEGSLREARELLPRLLTDPKLRGRTLLTMAAVETALGESNAARGYLEAAAREFADRFDLDALEKAATLEMNLVGKEVFATSPVHDLLEQSRARLKPLDSFFDARSFRELSLELREELSAGISLRTLAQGEDLVREGEPSTNVFVVKSGLLGVWLEKPQGGHWMVRACFPGWLLGESSVLGGLAPRCTATLRADRISEVWQIDGAAVRAVMDKDSAFRTRILETKQIHRIDSFFSMHETMGTLDVQVRDEMLSCIQRLETFDKDTEILKANEVPHVGCLVARGSIALVEDGKTEPLASVKPDFFYGIRDTIHQIAPSVAAIAKAGTTVAFFDGKRLQKLCEESPENVVAVLERLG